MAGEQANDFPIQEPHPVDGSVRRYKDPQLITMQLIRGVKNPEIIKVTLMPPGKNYTHPFMAVDSKGREIILQQGELLSAYGLFGSPPPRNLTEGLRTSKIIAERKRNKPRKSSKPRK